MAEQTSQIRTIPLRLRFRASNQTISALGGSLRSAQPPVVDLSNVSETERYIQQIRELGRLGNLLRADLSLDELLQQIVASAAACTGFRVLVIRLFDEGTKQLTTVAFKGVPEDPQSTLNATPISRETLQRLMQPEFRLSQSYFIPHEYIDHNANQLLILSKSDHQYEAGTWHPGDLLFVPLYSSREQKLLGTVSLDDPVDGKLPTIESIELVQLFVNMAAIALDNTRLFQEREKERLALEDAIQAFAEDIETLQKGNFRHHITARHRCLERVVSVVNALTEKARDILDNVRLVTHTVDDHMHNIQKNAQQVLNSTNRQESQVKQISQVMSEMAKTMHHITESAAMLSKTAAEAADFAFGAQDTVDHTVKGMMTMRESTLRSAHTIKGLIESGQHINSLVLAPTELTTCLHVLALNAAIEATRVGEQGRGFALIAQELRALAASNKEAIHKTEEHIRSNQNKMSILSQSIEENTQNVIIQTELAIQAGVTLEAINTITEQLPGLVKGICIVAENQSQGSQMAVNALNEIFCMKTDITDQIQEMQQSLVHLAELNSSLRSRMASLCSREH